MGPWLMNFMIILLWHQSAIKKGHIQNRPRARPRASSASGPRVICIKGRPVKTGKAWTRLFGDGPSETKLEKVTPNWGKKVWWFWCYFWGDLLLEAFFLQKKEFLFGWVVRDDSRLFWLLGICCLGAVGSEDVGPTGLRALVIAHGSLDGFVAGAGHQKNLRLQYTSLERRSVKRNLNYPKFDISMI